MADATTSGSRSFHRAAFRYLTVALLAATSGYWAARQRAGETNNDLTEADVDQVIKAVDFEHSKLSDAITSLGHQAGINVTRRQTSSNADLETPVSLHLRQVTFATAVDAILSKVPPPNRLDWYEEGGVVYVDDRESIEADPAAYRWRIYDVHDVLEESSLKPVSTNPNAFRSSNYDAEAQRWDEFKKLIIDTVDPPSWMDNGGKIARIESWGGLLVVQQTPRNQRAIESFLANLRSRGH